MGTVGLHDDGRSPRTSRPRLLLPNGLAGDGRRKILLSYARRLVHDAGGEVSYCDTDSLLVIAREHGGFVPCTGGPYRIPDGSRAVRALLWSEIDAILERLTALKVYNPDLVVGSSFKIEDENFDPQGMQQQLWFYGSREKSYALFAIDAAGEPIIVKHSAHSIGQYRPPFPSDRADEWIVQAWTHVLRAALGLPNVPLGWEKLPAIAQLTLTTWNVMKHYANTSGVHPYDFLTVAQAAFPGLLRCCQAPRPSCLPFADARRWAEQPWRCLTCDAPINPRIPGTNQLAFKTYGRVVGMLANAVELKRLVATGEEPTYDKMLGCTAARPVERPTYLYVYTRARYPFWLSTYLPRGLPSDPPTDTFLQADAGWKDGRLELNKVTPICLTRKECP